MNKATEKPIKRRVILADGRYLIFYTFAPWDAGDSSSAEAEVRANSEGLDEEN